MGKRNIAYIAPFVIFVLMVGISQGLEKAGALPWGMEARYLVFPGQTVVCAAALWWYWPQYRLGLPRKGWAAVVTGVVVFALWISPQAVFHRAPRVDGFNVEIFAGRPGIYWTELVLRLARLVIVVPLLEEIFWRGFLLRYVVNEDFEAVPFGTYGGWANGVVAVGFMLEHSMDDWPAALATGLLYNLVAYRTKSLSSCVLAHAITNALLGVFILTTRQWGFW